MGDEPRGGEVEALIREIQRYLAILEALRVLSVPQDRPGAPPEKS
jgi:hypothetical protein